MGRRKIPERRPEHGRHLGSGRRFNRTPGHGHVRHDEDLRLVARGARGHVTEDVRLALQIDSDLLPRLPHRGREHRAVLRATPAAGQADLPGPWIALSLRALPQKDLKISGSILEKDHHRGGRLRLQLRLRELEGEEELAEPLEGRFGHWMTQRVARERIDAPSQRTDRSPRRARVHRHTSCASAPGEAVVILFWTGSLTGAEGTSMYSDICVMWR